jgi:putative N6-adenine-specific DNA methylase
MAETSDSRFVTRESAERFDAFAVTAPGLEPILAHELTALGLKELKPIDGGVEFSASAGQLYEANLQLRTASRVLVRLAEFKALTFADLERRARRVPWENVLSKSDSVSLRVTCHKSRLYHSDAVAERIARDIVNRIGARTSPALDDVDADSPGDTSQLIVVRFDRDRCTISADSSGAHLHQRGYRTSVTQAPMRETLAAALVIASKWDQQSPLLDPFSGSGTIPIEAALLAARIAPGKNRRFRFMAWPGFRGAEWKRVLANAVSQERADSLPLISGSDRSVAALRAATDNADRAGVRDLIRLEKRDALKLEGQAQPGWIVSNPPYGVRLGDRAESHRLFREFGQLLRAEFGGWHVTLLAATDVERVLQVPLKSRLQTTNGGLRVQVLTGVVPAVSGRSATRRAARP